MAAAWLVGLGIAVIVLPLLYIYTVSVVQTRFPTLRNKRICLLVAHPDDEAMFFAPTVLALTRPETGNHVKILCLSSGDANGLGETRKKELVKSGMLLGLRKEDDVFVIDHPDFPDSMTTTWEADKISALLCSAFAPNLAKTQASPTAAPSATIDVLVTFDASGVSSHPNHISLYHGAHAFVAALVEGKAGHAAPVDLYTLTSLPVWRKYASLLDAAATLAAWGWATTMAKGPKDTPAGGDGKHPAALVFMSSLVGDAGLRTAWRAMTTAHKSQMVWFRWGWITLSRYMVINDLRLEKIRTA